MSAGPLPRIVPAPWRLRCDGVVLVLRARSAAATAPGLAGQFSAVALFDYSESPVGPYRELLHVPRVLRLPGAAGPTVRDIWVDSALSAASGNANWGLTKSVVRLDRSVPQPGPERWIAADRETTLADVTHAPFGPPIPFVKPARLAPFVQRRDDRVFKTSASACGLARRTRVSTVTLDPEIVVDLEQHRIIGAFAVSRVRMRFPRAHVTGLRHD